MTPTVSPGITEKLISVRASSPPPAYFKHTFLNSTAGTCVFFPVSDISSFPSAILDLTANMPSILFAHARAFVILITRLASLISSTRICDI